MQKPEKNYAFIDSQNVNLGISNQGWELDFGRFRKYLRDKYSVVKAYLFIGYLAGNESLYTRLQNQGYICIFKSTLKLPSGKIKVNFDAELVLHTMIQYHNFNQAIIATGDGDFHCLIKYLLEKGKLKKVLIPNERRYSALLKKLSSPQYNIFDFMNQLESKLAKRKRLHRD